MCLQAHKWIFYLTKRCKGQKEARRQFHLEDGDYLEAEAVEDGILLRPSR
jgi:hypothetical protein